MTIKRLLKNEGTFHPPLLPPRNHKMLDIVVDYFKNQNFDCKAKTKNKLKID